MTDQPQPVTISGEEMKGALEKHWASITSNLVLQNYSLEKQVEILKTSIAQLEAEIVELQPLRATISREGAAHASGGRAIIQGEQKSRPD